MKRIFITLFAAFLSLGFFGCLSLGSVLIDDGVSSRGHRKNIMSKDFQLLG